MAKLYQLNLIDDIKDGFPTAIGFNKNYDYKFVISDAGIESLYDWEKRKPENRRKLILNEIEKTLRFLDNIHVMLPRKKVYGSYGLKHIVEDVIGEYVSNGSLIYAALISKEFKVTKAINDKLNAYISLKTGATTIRHYSKDLKLKIPNSEADYFYKKIERMP